MKGEVPIKRIKVTQNKESDSRGFRTWDYSSCSITLKSIDDNFVDMHLYGVMTSNPGCVELLKTIKVIALV